MRFVLWRKSVRAYFQNPSLPVVAVEKFCRGGLATRTRVVPGRAGLTDGLDAVFLTAHQYRSVPPTPVTRRIETDIGAENRAGATKEILEVLPANAVRKLNKRVSLQQAFVRAPVGLTFPTKRLTRPSTPTAAGWNMMGVCGRGSTSHVVSSISPRECKTY